MAKEFQDFEIELDQTNIEAYDGAAGPKLPPGEYELNVINVEHKPAKTSGSPMIAVTFQVPADATEHAGSFAYNNYMLDNDTGRGRLKQLQMACGANLAKFVASELVGARIKATVVHTEGKAQPQPDGTVKPGGTFVNVMNERPIGEEETPKETAVAPPVTKAAAPKPNTTAAPKTNTTASPKPASPRRQA